MTQTPASGPLVLVTVPPMASATMWMALSAAPAGMLDPANRHVDANRAAIKVRFMFFLPELSFPLVYSRFPVSEDIFSIQRADFPPDLLQVGRAVDGQAVDF